MKSAAYGLLLAVALLSADLSAAADMESSSLVWTGTVHVR